MPEDIAPQTPPASGRPVHPVRVPLATEPMGIFRSLGVARRNLLELIPEIATRQPMVSGRTGKRWHMVMDPGALKRILKDKVEDYPKSDVTKLILGPAIGDSMFIAEGAHWHWQRRTAAPVFSLRNIQNLAPVMTAAAERACARIADAEGRAADLFAEMIRATYEVISDVTFSGEDEKPGADAPGPQSSAAAEQGSASGRTQRSGFDAAAVHRAIDAYIGQTAKVSLLDIIGAPMWVPRPSRMVAAPAMREMKAMADAAIEARRTSGARAFPDLLDLLLAGEDPESARRMTTAELRDNLLTFIVAGHETTALTLAWSLYLCAFDQGVQARARTEAQSVLGAGTSARAATVSDIAALPHIRRIVDEALRLYPPAAFLSRTARVHDNLGGRAVRPGDTVMLPVYALHRHHALWPDPDRFDPDRFADPRAIDRFAYLPFGDGPRICIGASFALQEAVIVLASLLARFAFTPVPGRDPRPVLILTLRPEGGVWLNVSAA